jgi:hypothetical protein
LSDHSGSLKAALRRRDVAAGVLMLVLGAVIAVAAFELRIGNPARMGPGFLPLGLGLLLSAAGMAIALSALREGENLTGLVWPRPLLVLVLAFVAFALLIDRAGLAPAGFAAVLIAGAAARRRKWWEGPLYAALLCAFAILIFVELLGMPLRVWP